MSRVLPGNSLTPRTLASIQGTPVDIPDPELLTHLQFRRFAGCPMCHLHLHSFIGRHAEMAAAGIQEIVVFHSSREALLKNQASAPFALIADPEKSLYREFGVESSIRSVLNPAAWPAAIKGLVRHGARMPGRGESPLGLPADFLIDRHGQVLASHYGAHAHDQWEVDKVLELARDAKGREE